MATPGQLLVGALLLAFVVLSVLASVFDTFPGDSGALEAIRVSNEEWRDFFAAFDLVPVISVVTVVALVVIMLVLRGTGEASAAFLIMPCQGILILLPKELVGRPRPPGDLAGGADSFPSGTSATAMLVLGLAIYFVGLMVKPRWLRLALHSLLVLAILAMGLFRMLAGEHWPSDVVGGYLAGGLGLVVIVWVYRRWLQRIAPRPLIHSR